jgi:hypothetical protein
LRAVAEIVQHGPRRRNVLRTHHLDAYSEQRLHKLLILLALQAWLAALDDFRNWLIREAA